MLYRPFWVSQDEYGYSPFPEEHGTENCNPKVFALFKTNVVQVKSMPLLSQIAFLHNDQTVEEFKLMIINYDGTATEKFRANEEIGKTKFKVIKV